MKRVYSIDVPMLLPSNADEALTVFNTIHTISNGNGLLLLMDKNALYELLLSDVSDNYELRSKVVEALSYAAVSTYSASVYSQYITHQPVMTNPTFSSKLNTAIANQMCAMCVQEEGKKSMFLVRASRWPEGHVSLDTTQNHQTLSHPVLCLDCKSLAAWLAERRPIYVPWRHGQEERGTKQRPISTFKAGANHEYAQKLLYQAYADTISDEEYPHYLYTYDALNERFVQYRYDRNCQYHGMDIVNDEDPIIPHYLHDKYHQ